MNITVHTQKDIDYKELNVYISYSDSDGESASGGNINPITVGSIEEARELVRPLFQTDLIPNIQIGTEYNYQFNGPEGQSYSFSIEVKEDYAEFITGLEVNLPDWARKAKTTEQRDSEFILDKLDGLVDTLMNLAQDIAESTEDPVIKQAYANLLKETAQYVDNSDREVEGSDAPCDCPECVADRSWDTDDTCDCEDGECQMEDPELEAALANLFNMLGATRTK